ncbi:NADPH:quinone reductase-like Zn-dependent oxidoreductase [Catenulispora sp. GP43]|uniref:hypothetical protein n=1 Tax=Catenulispora sp. GP43 TaxID=3156263 RepID=UPI0035113CB0
MLLWGGSTSVGSNAVHFAAAAGYEVIANSSPRNCQYVTSLGAVRVVDHNSPSVVADIGTAFAGRTLVGAIAFGATGAAAGVRIAGACMGAKFVRSPPRRFRSPRPTTRTDRGG